MRLFYLVFFFLFPFYCCSQIASTDPLVLYQVTEQNGLSDDHVLCVLKDHNGFVWIGTADGLNIMDGSQIRIFKHNDRDSQSIISNKIICLAEDAQGNMWIGTDKGLSKYDPLNHTFSSYLIGQGIYGATYYVVSIVIDKKQRLWCATDGGLFLFDTSKKKFYSFFNAETNSPYVNRINYVMEDHNQQLWICSFSGLWTFNTESHDYKKAIYPGNDSSYDELFIYAIEDHTGKIWAGTWSGGLKKLDPKTEIVHSYKADPLAQQKVSCIVEIRNPDGRYVLWLNGKLLGFDPSGNKFFSYPKPFQLSDYPNVSFFYSSNDRWVWMGSDKGLFIYNPQRQAFHHRFAFTKASQGLNLAEWNNLLLVGGDGVDFLKIFDQKWNLKKDYNEILTRDNPITGSQNASLLSFEKEDSNNFWIGTSAGLLHMDLATGKNRWWISRAHDSLALPRNFITHMFLDSKKQLWVFPWRSGIWVMEKEKKTFRNVFENFIMQAGQKKKLLIADAIEDDSGNIWMADLDEGIILYERKTGKFSKPFAKELGERANSSKIFYRRGFCYSMVDRSLIKWKPGANKILKYTLPPEINKDVTDITPDNKNNWWIATKNGLIVFKESSGTFQRFTTADGLASNDMSGTLYCRANGNILFAVETYITTFNPDELLMSTRSEPNTEVTDVLVNGKEVLYDSARQLQLNYSSNNLLFRWTIPEFSNPFHNQFYCKLLGIDRDWRYTGNKGEIQYANLSPGYYQLQLRGVTANGSESKDIKTIRFEILPPFWKRAWFIAFFFIMIIAAIYAWYRYRLQQAIKLERLRTKISTDLHDDIGSTLSSISILSDIALKENDARQSGQMIQEIKDSSVLLMEKMDDIVWSINPKKDTIEDLMLRIKRFGARLFEAKDIDYAINIDDSISGAKLSMENRQHIYLIMKEAINNLVKYSRCTKAFVDVKSEHDFIKITIKDNGKGFDAQSVQNGNGVMSMRRRAEAMKAELHIISEDTKGTQVFLQVKIK